MADLKPNSHRYKAEQKEAPVEREKREKVVSSKVTTKKNQARRFADVFLAEDIGSVKDHVLMEILVPAISNTILDIITNAANMVFGKYSGTKKRNGTRISYSRISDPREGRRSETRAQSRLDYEDIVFDSYGDAEIVLEEMDNVLEDRNEVTVADLYDLCGLYAPFTLNKYGWTNLSTAKVMRSGTGYIIKLPKARMLVD
jgi:hypothetical protein